jgi:hypothetical protein
MHSVVLVRDTSRFGGEEDVLVGSGTLVKAGSFYGILTASHVLSEARNADGSIRIVYRKFEHDCTIPADRFTSVTIGHYQESSQAQGPDLAFIRLLECPALSSLRDAAMSFFSLEPKFVSELKVFLDADRSWFILGAPKEKTLADQESEKFAAKTGLIQFCSRSIFSRYFSVGDFDYLEVVAPSGVDNFPRSYEGMSGGGAWAIPVYRQNDGSLNVGDPIFGGVPFFEEDPIDGSRIIRLHGPISVHEMARKQIIAGCAS